MTVSGLLLLSKIIAEVKGYSLSVILECVPSLNHQFSSAHGGFAGTPRNYCLAHSFLLEFVKSGDERPVVVSHNPYREDLHQQGTSEYWDQESHMDFGGSFYAVPC